MQCRLRRIGEGRGSCGTGCSDARSLSRRGRGARELFEEWPALTGRRYTKRPSINWFLVYPVVLIDFEAAVQVTRVAEVAPPLLAKMKAIQAAAGQ